MALGGANLPAAAHPAGLPDRQATFATLALGFPGFHRPGPVLYFARNFFSNITPARKCRLGDP
jgi:hypothetical protein